MIQLIANFSCHGCWRFDLRARYRSDNRGGVGHTEPGEQNGIHNDLGHSDRNDGVCAYSSPRLLADFFQLGLCDWSFVRYHSGLYLLCRPELETKSHQDGIQRSFSKINGSKTEITEGVYTASWFPNICHETSRLL